MTTALNYRYPGLEAFTVLYDVTNRLFFEHKLEVPMEKKKELNVLLADDDDDDRDFFTEVITEIAPKVKVNCVKNGAALMEHISKAETSNLPDLIFLDLNMPCKNGKECLKELKKNIRLRHIPVIIYSTSSHIKDIESAYNEGADLYVTKPNTCSELKRIAKKVLGIDWNSFVLNHRIERFVLK